MQAYISVVGYSRWKVFCAFFNLRNRNERKNDGYHLVRYTSGYKYMQCTNLMVGSSSICIMDFELVFNTNKNKSIKKGEWNRFFFTWVPRNAIERVHILYYNFGYVKKRVRVPAYPFFWIYSHYYCYVCESWTNNSSKSKGSR